ncbi:ACT domain-containing protein [Proteiniclasticum sp. QWL-01]|uniref:ACT domain-containing protein n=1 Tax=Proteiniclasticum sp. QWL-01 TaxID=3036945 RepID=UPI00220C28FE|nr:ACT domain-containing protein [Proteiniclasticum sp. QWL-01]UUM11235.1 ACT domain-containing protein [Clostridiaceae bacterium HFYG-1003]WFF72573.1 ACT domain-containing protein [Proteiniclasticum sp. QWL-01]
MKDQFFIVNGTVLPEIFGKIIEVKTLLATRKVKDITEGVKKAGISRSVFYKYKDNVFLLSEMSRGRKASISILLDHKPGALSKVLDLMAGNQANILTINQGVPINDAAMVTMTVDISDMSIDIKDLIDKLLLEEYVLEADISAME